MCAFFWYYHIKLVFFFTVDVFGPCVRTLAVILVLER